MVSNEQKPRILFAADNRRSAGLLQERFVQTYSGFWDIRTSAYSSSIGTRNVDWNLDALVDFTGKPRSFRTRNSNYLQYVGDIRQFAPHLVVSDLELRTSWIAIELGIPVWQVSSLLLHYCTPGYSGITRRFRNELGLTDDAQLRRFVFKNSDKLLVVSHFCDLDKPPRLESGFEWLRPNFVQVENQHRITSTALEVADSFYSGHCPRLEIDWRDMESFVVAGLCKKYTGALEIDSGVKFLSQHVRDSGIQLV